MTRTLKIAVREYLSYIRTVGFWLSMCVMPLGFLVAFAAPGMLERSAPIPRLVVVDLTGRDYAVAVAEAIRTPRLGRGRDASRPAATLVAAPTPLPGSPGLAARALRPRLMSKGPDRLDAAAVIHPDADGVAVDVWSRNVADRTLEGIVRGAVERRMRIERMITAGVPQAQISAIENSAPRVTAYSPNAAGKVGLRERLPGVVGFGLGFLLWTMIVSGAGILLNSVIEEKSSRVLEVLMASASAREIMAGKILGVAGVTATVLGVWISVGATVMAFTAPHLLGDLASVVLERGLVVYFAVFLIGGYLMYAALFTAIGAFCETVREAQTLLAPVMMLITVPIVFMGQAIVRPDTPVLAALSWFPPFTPFLMPARAASGAPMWQVVGAAVMMAVATAASLWLSERAFRAGALSSGKFDPRAALALIFPPKKA